MRTSGLKKRKGRKKKKKAMINSTVAPPSGTLEEINWFFYSIGNEEKCKVTQHSLKVSSTQIAHPKVIWETDMLSLKIRSSFIFITKNPIFLVINSTYSFYVYYKTKKKY